MKGSERKFPALFKSIIAKHGIKNIDLAKMLGVTSQYISKLQNTQSLPSREQMTEILRYLESHQVSLTERRLLTSYFVEDKTGFFYEIADLEYTACRTPEKKLLSDFRLLDRKSQEKVLSYITQLVIEQL